jgi:ribonuclease R
MEQFVGQTFDAVVSGVANYGLYVRLDNCAEGLVSVRSLGDEYFIFDPVRYVLRGSDTQKTFRLGQSIHVKLVEADMQSARLNFVLA